MNTIYGYARVSSTDQDLDIQKDALRVAGCGVIRSEKISDPLAARSVPAVEP